MKKIVIIGNAGSGKSTLAKELGAKLNIPVFHLDMIFHLPGGAMLDKESFAEKQAEIMSGERWIIDGNYGGTMPLRISSADTVILLDFSTLLCLFRVIRRSYGRKKDRSSRTDIPEYFEEKLDKDYLAFLLYILKYKKALRPRALEHLKNRPENTKLIVVKNKKQLSGLLNNAAAAAGEI